VAENKVILEFVGDVSGLKPAIDTLSQLGNLSEEQVEAFKKANEQFKKTSQTANEADKSVSKLATSFKQVSGAVAGKAIVEPLNDMKKAADNTTASVNNLGKSSQSLKSRLREIKNELAGLDEGSKRFQQLSQEAGVLEDRIGDVNARVRRLASDTQGLDALLGAAQGIAGAFSIAQGAAALFGKENEDLQKALLRVQASLSVLNGLQAVAATLNKDSAFSVIFLSRAKEAYNIAITKASSLTRIFGITAAQAWAAATLGLSVLVAAVAALVLNFDEVAKSLGFVDKENDNLNKTLQKQIEVQKQLRLEKENRINQLQQQLDLEVELLKLSGADPALIRQKELNKLEAERNLIANQIFEIEQKLEKIKYSDSNFKLAAEEARKEGEAKLISLQREEQILEAKIKGLINQGKKVKETKKENDELGKQEIILKRITSLTRAENITESITKQFTEALRKGLDEKDLSKLLEAKLEKVDVPALKIPLELEKSVQFQQFVKNELPQILTQATQEAFNATFAILSNARQAQFDEENQLLEQRRERELANKNLTESQKASIEKKFEQQRAAIRQRQFQAEKQAAIAQALINGALAVTNILATTPKADFGAATFALLALNTIQTAAQVAVISSQKAPKFAKGGWIDGKPHSQGGTLIEAEKDEFVVRKSAATKNRSFLEAFNNTGNVAKALDLIGYMPQIRDNDMIVMENKTNIDYSKLGRAVAREMAKLPQSELEVNYRGLLTSINSQQSLIEWQKRKYN
jgi:hypothetical protein